jgi:hypothetical protein
MIRTIPDTKPVYGVDPTADPNVLGRNALHHIGTMGSKDRVVMGMDKKGNPVKMEVGPQLRGLTGEGLNDLSPTEKDLVLKMARSNQQGTFSGDTSVPRVYQGPIDRRSREDVILGARVQTEIYRTKLHSVQPIVQSLHVGQHLMPHQVEYGTKKTQSSPNLQNAAVVQSMMPVQWVRSTPQLVKL